MNASAPGKIILFGEHAVVYNRPALAVPVTQVHVDVEVLDSPSKGIWINAPDVDLHAELNSLPADHPVGSVILNLFSTLGLSSPLGRGQGEGLEISITSTIPVAAGLGSGAAVSVALIRALAQHVSHPLTDEQVNDLVFEIEKLHHGTPSGIDNTVITYAKPVYFVKGKLVETFKVGKPFTIVIGDTGTPAPTKESVGDVRRLRMHDQHAIEDIFNEIAQIALIGRRSIESGMPELLGELMDQNHVYLQALTVSSPELDKLVEAARNAGALGAKLSGGGRGGNMIALVEPTKAAAVASALMSAGAKRTIITENKLNRHCDAELVSYATRYFNSKGDCRAAIVQERWLAMTSRQRMSNNKKWFAPILPYLAVWLGLYLFKNAWFALIGFHIAILLALMVVRPNTPINILFKSKYPQWILINILICSASGIGLYFLWNLFDIVPDLPAQLGSMGLNSSVSWLAFITYFSLINPFVEEYFWRGVLGSNSKKFYIGDLVYAGYHAVVLWGKVPPSLVLFAVITLTSAGWFWRQSSREDEGLFAAVLGHMVADFSILMVVYLMCA